MRQKSPYQHRHLSENFDLLTWFLLQIIVRTVPTHRTGTLALIVDESWMDSAVNYVDRLAVLLPVG